MSSAYSETINPLRAPEPLPILNASNFVPKNGFPVVKRLTKEKSKRTCGDYNAWVVLNTFV